ncbi:energy transducer TonB [Chryseobacterium luteum]|nr:TonB family protein [Chryseobacterium luteum]
MIRILILFLTVFFIKMLGQGTVADYPKGMESYEGGEVQFYRDFHQILIDKGLKPCENKSEFYNLKIVVYEDTSVKYGIDNSETASKNKCALELGVKVLEYMNKWKPAVINGIKKTAVTSFLIVPDLMFSRYEDGYTAKDLARLLGLPGGINSFRAEVAKQIDLNGFVWTQPFKLVVNFSVSKEGKMENVKLQESSGNTEFDQRIIDGIKRMRKKKWTPAKRYGEPVESFYTLPLTFHPPK